MTKCKKRFEYGKKSKDVTIKGKKQCDKRSKDKGEHHRARKRNTLPRKEVKNVRVSEKKNKMLIKR